MSLNEGAITFEIAPFLDPLDAVAAVKEDWVVDDTHLQGSDRVCFAGQDKREGLVCAAERRWCAEGACTAEEVIGYAKAQASVFAETPGSSSNGEKPSTSHSQHTQMSAGVERTVHEFSAKSGLTIWQRSVVWQEGDVVVERVCICSGNPCRLMEKTCSIAEPS